MAQDLNNDNALTTGAAETGKGDYMIIGTSDPKLFGGLSNTITYKGFQLDILFQGIKRKSTRGDFSVASYPGQNYNMPESLLDLPVKYSATAGSAAINAFSYYRSSDASFQDASFIRLKNVSLAYSFPYQLIRRVKMNSLQVYVHAQNLLTFTGYKGVDPETMSINLPPLRMLIAGIKATF
jgi:hypothetical protein